MHVGFALLTLFPGRVGGSETYVRGLLGEYAAGNGPERVTILANRHVAAAYAASSGARSSCTRCAPTGPATGCPRARWRWRTAPSRPGWPRATCRRASTSSTTRSRCRSRALGRPDRGHAARRPAPRAARVLLARRARLPALGLRPRRARRRRRGHDQRVLARRRIVETLGHRRRSAIEVVHARGRPRALHARAGRRRRAASSTCPSASSSIRRTSGRTRTTSA